MCVWGGGGWGFCACVCVCVCVCFQISVLKPLGQLKPNLMWNLHGIRGESLFKWSRSFVVLHYCQPPRGGAFSRDFTINLSPQCRAFSRALKTEKLKAPLFPDPVGAGTTNCWCIIQRQTESGRTLTIRINHNRSIAFRLPILKPGTWVHVDIPSQYDESDQP